VLIGYCVKVFCGLKTAICKKDVPVYCFEVSRYLFYTFYSWYVNRCCVLGRGLNGVRVLHAPDSQFSSIQVPAPGRLQQLSFLVIMMLSCSQKLQIRRLFLGCIQMCGQK
jgi:hypothetical protein